MRTIKIPLVDRIIIIYSGKNEWKKYCTVVNKKGCVDVGPNTCYEDIMGRCYGSWVFVHDIKDTATLIHEMSHFIDELMKNIGTDDTEFRAYITEYIMMKVIELSKENQNGST